jgi:uncharacterized membrane protein YhdT
MDENPYQPPKIPSDEPEESSGLTDFRFWFFIACILAGFATIFAAWLGVRVPSF